MDEITNNDNQPQGYWRIHMTWAVPGHPESIEEEEWSVVNFKAVKTIVQKMENYIACEITFVQFTDPDSV